MLRDVLFINQRIAVCTHIKFQWHILFPCDHRYIKVLSGCSKPYEWVYLRTNPAFFATFSDEDSGDSANCSGIPVRNGGQERGVRPTLRVSCRFLVRDEARCGDVNLVRRLRWQKDKNEPSVHLPQVMQV